MKKTIMMKKERREKRKTNEQRTDADVLMTDLGSTFRPTAVSPVEAGLD